MLQKHRVILFTPKNATEELKVRFKFALFFPKADGRARSSVLAWNAACSEGPAAMLKVVHFFRGGQLSRHLSCREWKQNKIYRRNLESAKSVHMAITIPYCEAKPAPGRK
jgi:hypothetical protein